MSFENDFLNISFLVVEVNNFFYFLSAVLAATFNIIQDNFMLVNTFFKKNKPLLKSGSVSKNPLLNRH